jgi:hypothetical protein
MSYFEKYTAEILTSRIKDTRGMSKEELSKEFTTITADTQEGLDEIIKEITI